MFAACSPAELARIAERLDEIPVSAGDRIVTEGDVGLEFFVILDGRAKVVRGGAEVDTMGPGDFFGELALLDHARRNATVEALTPMTVASLPRRTFDALFTEIPTLARHLLVGMARRLRDLDSRV
jgi:CRP-like cAMP-binding protein